jgi:hypothetical protein
MSVSSQATTIPPRRASRWVLIIGAAIVALVALYAVLFHPRYTSISTASGETYDVIQVARDDGIGALFGPRAEGAGPALVVNYYARAGDLAEARQLQEYAVPLADSAGLRFIVVSQTTPTITRWLPFVRGQMWAWRRWGAGNWRLVE